MRSWKGCKVEQQKKKERERKRDRKRTCDGWASPSGRSLSLVRIIDHVCHFQTRKVISNWVFEISRSQSFLTFFSFSSLSLFRGFSVSAYSMKDRKVWNHEIWRNKLRRPSSDFFRRLLSLRLIYLPPSIDQHRLSLTNSKRNKEKASKSFIKMQDLSAPLHKRAAVFFLEVPSWRYYIFFQFCDVNTSKTSGLWEQFSGRGPLVLWTRNSWKNVREDSAHCWFLHIINNLLELSQQFDSKTMSAPWNIPVSPVTIGCPKTVLISCGAATSHVNLSQSHLKSKIDLEKRRSKPETKFCTPSTRKILTFINIAIAYHSTTQQLLDSISHVDHYTFQGQPKVFSGFTGVIFSLIFHFSLNYLSQSEDTVGSSNCLSIKSQHPVSDSMPSEWPRNGRLVEPALCPLHRWSACVRTERNKVCLTERKTSK